MNTIKPEIKPVKFGQMSIVIGQRSGQWVRKAFGDTATQVAAIGFDAFDVCQGRGAHQ